MKSSSDVVFSVAQSVFGKRYKGYYRDGSMIKLFMAFPIELGELEAFHNRAGLAHGQVAIIREGILLREIE